MSDTKTHQEHIDKIAHMIKDARVAMLTNITESGALHARPMQLLEASFDGDLWFFTGKTSPKILEIQKDDRVNVPFSDAKEQDYVSLCGHGRLVVDADLNKKYWNPAFQAWFPKGLDDPELALLQVQVDGAEYWDAPSSTVAHVKGLIQAKLTGQPGDPGDHAKVGL